jgi:hypothetical protein
MDTKQRLCNYRKLLYFEISLSKFLRRKRFFLTNNDMQRIVLIIYTYWLKVEHVDIDGISMRFRLDKDFLVKHHLCS